MSKAEFEHAFRREQASGRASGYERGKRHMTWSCLTIEAVGVADIGNVPRSPTRHDAVPGVIACAGSGIVSRCFSAVGCETMRNAFESFRSRQNESCA